MIVHRPGHVASLTGNSFHDEQRGCPLRTVESAGFLHDRQGAFVDPEVLSVTETDRSRSHGVVLARTVLIHVLERLVHRQPSIFEP